MAFAYSIEQAKYLMLGALATVTFSLTGYVLIPTLAGVAEPVTREDGSTYPVALTADEAAGRQVYIDLGCMMCHTQQVRDQGFGADIERGWGKRGSLPVDYIGQQPTLLGTMRTGPDLANIGARQPSDMWQMMHLYDPRSTSPGSNMPPFRYLFDVVDGKPAGSFVPTDGTVPEGKSVVPTERGRHLVAYLLSLHQDPKVGESL